MKAWNSLCSFLRTKMAFQLLVCQNLWDFLIDVIFESNQRQIWWYWCALAFSVWEGFVFHTWIDNLGRFPFLASLFLRRFPCLFLDHMAIHLRSCSYYSTRLLHDPSAFSIRNISLFERRVPPNSGWYLIFKKSWTLCCPKLLILFPLNETICHNSCTPHKQIVDNRFYFNKGFSKVKRL